MMSISCSVDQVSILNYYTRPTTYKSACSVLKWYKGPLKPIYGEEERDVIQKLMHSSSGSQDVCCTTDWCRNQAGDSEPTHCSVTQGEITASTQL